MVGGATGGTLTVPGVIDTPTRVVASPAALGTTFASARLYECLSAD